MKILEVTQGSPEWLAIRAKHLCASDAAAMMGVGAHMTRTELLRLSQSGDERQFSDWQQRHLLDKGHEFEAAARAIVEAELGEDLYPATIADDDDRLLASFDGITMDGETGFEHKMWNVELAAAVRAGDLPPAYYWQLEQQILVGGLKRVIFVCSDGTPERLARMEYMPVLGRAQQLLAGWKQFEEDAKTYQHVEVAPTPTAQAITALPALTVQLVGEVKSSNLVAYREAAETFIKAINTNLQTDQDFADAEKTVKFCGDAEERLEVVKAQALSQTASIDELFRTIDSLSETMRGKRLELEKLVKARKDTIRDEIRREGCDAFAAHVAGLNTRLGKPYMPVVPYDFAGVMKGKKTITSLRDAVNTELARAKIEANAIADRIDINLKHLDAHGADYAFLFADIAHIAGKEPEDFQLLVASRILGHKAKEQARLDAERERIRQEEAAKLAKPPTPVTAQPAPAPVKSMGAGARPADAEIIQVLATHYSVAEPVVVKWLGEMVFKTKRKAA